LGRRGQAVVECLRSVLSILTERNHFESAKEYAKKFEPEIYELYLSKKTIPKWSLDLITVLTKLYDEGHADAMDDLNKMR